MRRRYTRGAGASKYQWLSVALITLGGVAFEIINCTYSIGSLRADVLQRRSTSDQMNFSIILLIIFLIYLIGVSIFVWWLQKRDLARLRIQMDGLCESSSGMSPELFLKNRLALKRAGDFTGIYILHNVSKDRYYVGQGVRVIDRVSQHFMGHGNADVYADWKYGDQFMIKTIPLQQSGYQSLNDLEHDAIAAYDACEHGYNRTHGNRN